MFVAETFDQNRPFLLSDGGMVILKQTENILNFKLWGVCLILIKEPDTYLNRFSWVFRIIFFRGNIAE